MKEIIQYQIEVAICMAALTLLYMIVWRKDTNFSFKRLLLLSIPLFSMAIPLINLSIDVQPKQASTTIQYMSYLPSQLELVYTPIVEKAETTSGWEIAFWIFAIGAGIMLIRLLVSYYKIWQLYQQSIIDATGKFRLIDNPIQSFSFFNLIMINRSQATSNERDYILAHEKAHSRQGHSYDVLWLETIKMLHWFNPLIWLITRESKQNMEYLADQEVTGKTQNIENYQYAIVSHATNSGYKLLKTQFSKSNLKNRIKMMNRPNNQNIKAGKLLILLPVLAILFMSFSLNLEHLDIKRELSEVLPALSPIEINTLESNSHLSINTNEIASSIEIKSNTYSSSSDTTSEEILELSEVFPYPSTGEQLKYYYQKLYKELKYPKAAKKQKISGSVLIQFIVLKDGSLKDFKVIQGLSPECDAEAIRLIKEGPSWNAGLEGGKPVNVRRFLSIQFGNKKYSDTNSKTIMGRLVNEKDFSAISGAKVRIKGTNIETTSNDEGIFKLNVESGHKEIIISSSGFEPKTYQIFHGSQPHFPYYLINYNENQNSRKIEGTIKNENGDPVVGCNVIIKGTNIGTISDGEGRFLIEVQPEHSELVFNYVSLESISINISESEELEILMKNDEMYKDPKASLSSPINNGKSMSLNDSSSVKIGRPLYLPNGEKQPLYIIDGKVVEDFKQSDINPDEIKSIQVLKDKSAETQFGEKGKNGVVIIKSKNGIEKSPDNSQTLALKEYTDVSIIDDDNKEGIKLKANGNFNLDKENPPVIYKDGIEISIDDIEKIDPTSIQSIEVIKGESAKSAYGEKGKNGVILIKMKK